MPAPAMTGDGQKAITPMSIAQSQHAIDHLKHDRAALVAAIESAGSTVRGASCGCPNPEHDDSNPSASIYQSEDGAWRVKCHACGFCEDVIGVRAAVTGKPLADVLRDARGQLSKLDSAPTPPRRQPKAKPKPDIDFAALHAECRAAIEPGEVADWADDALGLDGVAVDALLPGWYEPSRCYVTPERDATGAIVGLLRRMSDGTKRRVKDSRCGISYVHPLPPTGTILVVEGPSDVAAATQAGFVAVGRPNNSGGGAMLAELLKGRRVIVLGENDRKPDGLWPGRDGAESIAKQLDGVCESVAVAYPPDGVKDIRYWLIGGEL